MGSVVNPSTLRLGWTNVWNFSWSAGSLLNYSCLAEQDFLIIKILNSFFRGMVVASHRFFYLINYGINIARFGKSIIIFISVTDSSIQMVIDRLCKFKYKIQREELSIVMKRYFYWIYHYFISSILRKWVSFSLKRLISGQPFRVVFNMETGDMASAKGLAMYIRDRLWNFHPIGFVMRDIVRYIRKFLLKGKRIWGCKIEYSGRLTKRMNRGRKISKWKIYGKMPLSSIGAAISYAHETVILKYSICGIRVWVYNIK